MPGGPGVRVDTFAHSECTISPYYDSMIAKIIVHGRDRQEAIARMRRTLEMTVIDGIKTSIPLHLKILADADFVAGRLSTSFMERYIVEKKVATASSPKPSKPAAAVCPDVAFDPGHPRCSLSHHRSRRLPRAAGSIRWRWRAACLVGGARLLQLRCKGMPGGAFLALADELVRMARAVTRQSSSSTIAPTSRG